MSTRRLYYAAGVALLLAGCGRHAPVSTAMPPPSVYVTTVQTRVLGGGLQASGVLVSREEVAVAPESPLAGYRVAQVYVEPDARVAKGQPLVRLDDTLLRAQIDQQAALVAEQAVAAEQAAEQAADVVGLEGKGLLSTEQIDQRRFAARSAEAALDAQKAQLRDLQAREARMIIRAPTAGLVLERNVRPGDVAAAGGTAMLTMARDSLVEFEADVAEGDLTGLKPGDAAEVSLPDGAVVAGRVRLIYPSVDSSTKLGKVRVALPVRDDLRPGGYGSADFTGLSRAVVAAPETAIRYGADGASMMVVGPGDKVRQAIVTLGAHSGGYVELIHGPPPGAQVLLGSSSFVLPGDEVRPIEASAGGGGGG